ncbi:MAG: S8 family serine peptidase [Hyphomonadaceae bacterium]|nr:S8 family serine peptidase [Hyphomonadaceae bacterium]
MIKHSRAGALGLAVAALMGASQAAAQTTLGPVGQELAWSSAAQRVGGFTSRAWATRGNGVTIAIVDSGIRADHREFEGALRTGFNAFTGATGTTAVADRNGHGTHVASIAAGRVNNIGMAGVASRATILPVQVFATGSTTDAVVARGLTWATSQRAFVVNMSLGGSAPSIPMRDAMRAGVNAGQLYVVAAGNEGLANPSWPASFASEAWARGQIIAVGAVDNNNVIAAFSNRAGTARNFFLVAPGTNIIGAYHTGSTAYVGMSGTSMAAPVVAGAAAVVKSTWTYLSAQQVANILFTTATDLGARGTDPIYGRGMINLTRALQPVGTVSAMGASGPVALGTGGTSIGPATFGPLAAAAERGALTGVVFDGFGRDFGYDFGWRLAAPRESSASVAGTALAARMGSQSVTMPGVDGVATLRLSASASTVDGSAPDTASFRFDGTDGSGWAVGYGDARQLAGLSPEGAQAPVHADGASLVTSGLVRGAAASAAWWTPVSETMRLSVAARTENGSQRLFHDELGPQARSRATAVDATLAWHVGPVAGSIGVSAVHEAGGRLGNVDPSELGLKGAAATLAGHASARWQAAPQTALVAAVAVGSTQAQAGAASSLVSQVEDTTTAAWSVGLAHTNLWQDGDRLDLSVGRPLSAVAGAMDLRLAVAADGATGAPLMEDRRIGLSSATPEHRFELAYTAPMGERGEFGLGMMARQNADGLAGRNEAAVAVRFMSAF